MLNIPHKTFIVNCITEDDAMKTTSIIGLTLCIWGLIAAQPAAVHELCPREGLGRFMAARPLKIWLHIERSDLS
jgi:hypothetical protein